MALKINKMDKETSRLHPNVLLAQIEELDGDYAVNENNHKVWFNNYIHLDKQTNRKKKQKQEKIQTFYLIVQKK